MLTSTGLGLLDELTIGQRVARCRRAKGMSQEVLAHLLGRSASWLTKVERGERQLDRMSIIHEIARVLKVDVTEITGQPYRPSTRSTGHESVPALRRVLLGYEPGGLDSTRADGMESLATLRRRLGRANQLRHDADYDRLGDLLPALLEDLQVASATLDGTEREDALALLAEACHCARTMLKKLGYMDLAWIATERGGHAARELGDPLLQAANAWSRTEVYTGTGATPTAIGLALATIARLDVNLGAASPEQVSLLGMMHLKAAWGYAYLNDERQARVHLDEAASVARLLGCDRNDYETLFGPTNVTIHRIGVAVELRSGGEAVRLASHVDPRTLRHRERRARFHLDVARGHAQLRREETATEQLMESERAAPGYLRNHPVAREIVTGMMQRAHRAINADLRGLSSKVGVF